MIALVATSAPSYLNELVALLIASAVIAYICHRLRVPPIVGFLITGVVIGPNALGLVRNEALIELAAEIGVVLLLFTLGIEFSLDRLARIKRAIFLGGGLQMAITIAATAALLALFDIDWRTGVFTGSIVALSSTALVLKLLEERSETTTAKGQLALGVLIFQDLSILVLVLAMPMLGGSGTSFLGIARSVAVAVIIVTIVVVVARRLMPIVLERVARTCSPEIFLLTVIAICFGTAWLTSLAGVSLSIGAFLAGLVVSESRFSHHAFAEILPLQILFSAVFFVSVGLLLDAGFVLQHPLLIVGVVAAIAVLKVITTIVAALVARYPLRTAVATGLLTAQIGEFSFVLERIGRENGLSAAGLQGMGGQIFIASAVILMILTPILATAARSIEKRSAEPAPLEEEVRSGSRVTVENHVIVAGYGSVARYLTRVLRDSGIPFVIVTLSPTGATEAERDGLPVILGDYSRRYVLDLANIDAAKMIVIPDDALDMARRVAAVARGLNPTLQIVVRTRSNADVDELMAGGADQVLVDELELGIQLFTRVLSEYRISREEIDDHVATVRAGGYAALRGGIIDMPLVVCEMGDECFDTRTFTVRPNSAAARMSVAEFETRTGAKIVAVERGPEQVADPPPDFVLTAGDRITARASAATFAAAAALLRSETSEETAAATARIVALTPEQRTTLACPHVAEVQPEITTAASGCDECLRLGDTWVHLRICMSCAGVRCCDSSKNRHATRHYEAEGHPIIKSFQPGESWAWCYPDQKTF